MSRGDSTVESRTKLKDSATPAQGMIKCFEQAFAEPTNALSNSEIVQIRNLQQEHGRRNQELTDENNALKEEISNGTTFQFQIYQQKPLVLQTCLKLKFQIYEKKWTNKNCFASQQKHRAFAKKI